MSKSIFYQSTSFDPLKISEVLQPSNLVHHTPTRAHRVTSFPTQTSETNMADSDEFSRDIDALSTEVTREILPYQFEPRVDPSQTTEELSDSESEEKCDDEGGPSQPPEDGANRWVLGLL